MSRDLIGMRIAILAADGVERIELEEPRGALYGAGALSDVLSLHGGEIQARQFDMIPAGTIPVDWVVGEARADAYDALLLPGGTVNPDQLRMNADAVGFVKVFAGTGKPIAAICHGPWTLLEAGLVRGVTLTSWPSLWTDLRNAPRWLDTESWTASPPPAARRTTCARQIAVHAAEVRVNDDFHGRLPLVRRAAGAVARAWLPAGRSAPPAPRRPG